jgi:hypothetical protein
LKQLLFTLLLLAKISAASNDSPVPGPCDLALYEMEAVIVARVDGVPLEEYAQTHRAEMMPAATAIYQSADPAGEIQRRYEECLREQ